MRLIESPLFRSEVFLVLTVLIINSNYIVRLHLGFSSKNLSRTSSNSSDLARCLWMPNVPKFASLLSPMFVLR